jgi:integrase
VLLLGNGVSHLRTPDTRRGWWVASRSRAIAVDETFPKLTIHDLRHTAASLAVSAGANVKAVQRMLGHASAAMTLDAYSDLFDDDLDAAPGALHAARAAQLA